MGKWGFLTPDGKVAVDFRFGLWKEDVRLHRQDRSRDLALGMSDHAPAPAIPNIR